MLKLMHSGIKLQSIDALGIARECGNSKAVNVVLIGLMAKSTQIGREVWQQAMEEVIPKKLLEVNIKAFDAGWQG